MINSQSLQRGGNNRVISASNSRDTRLDFADATLHRQRELQANAEGLMNTMGEKTKAFEASVQFFCYQVAFSSFSNIIGTVLGHPLDTIRVSLLRALLFDWKSLGLGVIFKRGAAKWNFTDRLLFLGRQVLRWYHFVFHFADTDKQRHWYESFNLFELFV